MTKSSPIMHLVLTPHRSLGPRGFAILMSVTAILSALIAGRFLMISTRTWPIACFLLLDIALLYWAFRASYRSAVEREDIWLDAMTLTIRQRDRRGRITSTDFNPHWVKVELQAINEFQNRLLLSSHGRTCAIGSFLAPHERVDICAAIQASLPRSINKSRSA